MKLSIAVRLKGRKFFDSPNLTFAILSFFYLRAGTGHYASSFAILNSMPRGTEYVRKL